MSYEEIDKSNFGNDVFTGGAEGRYAKAKPTTEKKKRAPKVPASTTNESVEQPYENGHYDEVVKTKKKSRKTQNEDGTSEVVPPADGETVVKPKKKRAPKVETNNENIDPIPPSTDEQPVKKKKSKTPKATPIDENTDAVEISTLNDFELSTDITTTTTTKVKKSKKHKTPKTSTDPTADTQTNDYSINPEFNNDVFTSDGAAYDSTAGDVSYDATVSYPNEGEQISSEPEKSEYEMAILDAYNNLGSKMNFGQFVGNDQWCILHLPKSARGEPKSRIRKILPGGKDDRANGKFPAVKTNQKSGFLSRFRTGVGSLVRDENNLLFGEQSNYEMSLYEEEENDVDTDDLHRYAQKLRELEDTDREINPEFLVLRDGKTVYAVHEADAEGKMTFSTRKPIYDRYSDQAIDEEPAEKKKILSRLKNPFNRNKDKDNKGSNSPKSSTGTPDPSRKRGTKKSANKTTDDDMATMANNEPLAD